jgi:hypothetical protein
MAPAAKAKAKPKATPRARAKSKLKGKPKNDKKIRYKTTAVFPNLQPLRATVGLKKKAARAKVAGQDKQFAFGYDLEIDPDYPQVVGTHVTVQGTVTDAGQLSWWYDDPDGNVSVPQTVDPVPSDSGNGYVWSVAFDVTDGPGDYLFNIEGTANFLGLTFDVIVSAWFTV